MRPHKRNGTHTIIINKIKGYAFSKKREKMTKQLKSKGGQMYKQSETDELFAFAKTKEGVIILIGKYKVSSKTFKNFEDAEEYIKSKPYEILINVTMLMTKLQDNEKETKENNPKCTEK